MRGNVGRVFRDPGFDELYFSGPGVRGNPDLRPEDGLSWDAGLELRPARGVALQVAAFGQRYDRVILFMPVQAHLIESRDDHGARISVRRRPRTPAWARGASPMAYTHLDAHSTRRRARRCTPPTRAPSVRPPAGTRRRAVAFLAADTRSEVRTDRFGYRRIPGHTLWDLGVNGPVGAGFEAGLTFRNIFDVKDAQDAVQQPLPGAHGCFHCDSRPRARRGERSVHEYASVEGDGGLCGVRRRRLRGDERRRGRWRGRRGRWRGGRGRHAEPVRAGDPGHLNGEGVPFSAPQAVVFAGDYLVVASTNAIWNAETSSVDFGEGFVTIINPKTGGFVNRFPTTQPNPQKLAVHGDRLFIVNTGTTAYDMEAGAVQVTGPGGINSSVIFQRSKFISVVKFS